MTSKKTEGFVAPKVYEFVVDSRKPKKEKSQATTELLKQYKDAVEKLNRTTDREINRTLSALSFSR